MKKLLMVALILGTTGVGVQAKQVQGKLNYSLAGTMEFSGTMNYVGYTGKGDVDAGFGVAGEYHDLVPSNQDVEWGVGLEYQLPRKLSKIEGNTPVGSPEYRFMPIYGTMIYTFPQQSLFIKGCLGYNFVFDANADGKSIGMGTTQGSMSGGAYYSLGGGLKLSNNLVLELLYSVYSGKISAPERIVWITSTYGVRYYAYDFDVTYKTINVTLSYLFDLK